MHAARCGACDDRIARELELFHSIALARDEETWRPAQTEAVLTRIRERRAQRWRFALGAVSYGGALAVVLNVAVALPPTDSTARRTGYSEFSGKEDLFLESLRFYLDHLSQLSLLMAEPLGWTISSNF